MAAPEEKPPARRSANGWTPVPDPTTLTNELVNRAVGALREVMETRLDGMDRATELLSVHVNHVPEEMQKQIVHVLELMEQRLLVTREQFHSIQTQFAERDTRAEQTFIATNKAIDAALQAQKEAVAAQNANVAQVMTRIDVSATKQIDQLLNLLQATEKAMNSKIDDLKASVALIEGRTVGIASASNNQQKSMTAQQGASGNQIALIAVILSAVALLVMIIPAMIHR
jgi:hypothetical protein